MVGIIFIGPNVGSAMVAWIGALLIGVAVFLTSLPVTAQEGRSRSILVLDQSEPAGSFYVQIFSGLRARINADASAHTTLFSESLNLSRFDGEAYNESLRNHFSEKYRGKDIGVIVAMGSGTLELVQRWRDELWPGIPVVFGMVDEVDYAALKLPNDATGSVLRTLLADSIGVARAVVPDLETVVLVGDHWDRQNIFRSWRLEIPKATAGLNVIDLVGATMVEVRKRVEALPARSAIVYSAMYSDGEGTYYSPAKALELVAETANRPIIVAAEPLVALGGIGGSVVVPDLIGADAAKLALRILHGEPASSIPVAMSHAVKPVFNWLQMQRWGVRESDLPSGSEVRFREPSQWEKYRWQTLGVATVLLVSTARFGRALQLSAAVGTLGTSRRAVEHRAARRRGQRKYPTLDKRAARAGLLARIERAEDRSRRPPTRTARECWSAWLVARRRSRSSITNPRRPFAASALRDKPSGDDDFLAGSCRDL